MNHRILFTVLFASTLVLAGCKPASETATPTDPADPATVAATQPAVDTNPTDVIAEVDNNAPPAGFDVRAFAGTFTGTLPCADCPGIDTTLELRPDGSYVLHEVYQDSENGTFDGGGTWTAEDVGKRIRLDPNSKDDDDRLYAIASGDELRMLDQDGNTIDSKLDYSLMRTGATK